MSFPTSYIKTTSSQVTRAADNCSRTLGQEFNASNWTLYFDTFLISAPTTTYLVTLTDGSTHNYVSIFSREVRVRSNYGEYFQIIEGLSLGRNKVALSYNSGVYTLVIDGTVRGSMVAPNINVSRLDIGDRFNHVGAEVFKEVVLIPRALSEAECSVLTSPDS